ncbi:MAG TPA: endonuclease/exonuclease/phosphatase family protein [Tepidisphaeraceae bacterium]|nr:endonuclease/exonuclease/phosphatase family protein [Tepidisphaeraceae bacterium]
MARRRSGLSAREQQMAADALVRLAKDPRGRLFLIITIVVGLIALGVWWWADQRKRDADARAGGTPTTTSPTPADGTIRVATWNLRKFADRDKPGQHPPDLLTIARIIKDAQFDVLAIQEVQAAGPPTLQKLRRQLNEPWRHAVTAVTGNNERYGFLYRADRVELLEEPRLYDGPEAGVFDRVPAIAKFRAGQFDFVLLTAHLWYGDKANNSRRRAEAAALLRIAQQLAAGPEKDVIVLGDFNEMRASGNLPQFEAAGFAKLNAEPTNLGSTEVYDNVLIDRRPTREFAGAAGVIRFDELYTAGDDKRAAEEISDHRPVWAQFMTAGPDDD